MNTLKENLQFSKDACHYVLNVKKVKGANWDQYRGEDSYESCMKKNGYKEASCVAKKDSVDICLYDNVRPQSTAKRRKLKTPTMIDQLRVITTEVETNRCGNCGEFSATAFIYLFDKKVRPIEWVALTGSGADHAFVIIGRAPGDINKYKSWGATAVICDPWGQGFNKGNTAVGTYPGSEFSSRMSRLITRFDGVKVLHREN